MPEIGVLGPSRDDEIVERNAAPFRDHFFARSIDSRDLRQDHIRVVLPTENAANRRRDISGRQGGGRDLIEQRLEQMVIVAIDDGDVEGPLRQLLGSRQTAEPCSDDHNARAPGYGLGHVGHDVTRLSLSRYPGVMQLRECRRPHWCPREAPSWMRPRIWTWLRLRGPRPCLLSGLR